MEKKKYELIPSDRAGLFRIKALRNFGDVKAGDIGGYVEGEHNLSHVGLCWIYDDAVVSGNADVFCHACVCGNAVVSGNAKVSGKACVYGMTEICGNAQVYGDAVVRGYAQIYGDAVVNKEGDYMVFQDILSSGRFFTWTRSNNKWKVGCFYGSGEELINKAYTDSEESGEMYEMCVNLVNQVLKEEKELADNK